MSKDSTPSDHFSPNATLAAIGLKLRSVKLFAPIEEKVKIEQKVIDHTPIDKLKDAFITMLAGAKGLYEINTILRADPALQRAFGREACAEQSTVQDTLDACSQANVDEMQEACDEIFRAHSRTARHDYGAEYLVADGDLTGLPAGKKAEDAPKGYLSGEGIRTGRQLARIVASQYDEVIVDRVYPGNTVLPGALRQMVEAMEAALNLTPEQRSRVILRLDAAGGSLDDTNWLLSRGYQVHSKDYSSDRARALASTVRVWYEDPKNPGREVGLVGADTLDFVHRIRRVAIRIRKKNGQWSHAVIQTTLEGADVLRLMGVAEEEVAHRAEDEASVLVAYAHFYDQRGGGAEVEIKADKQSGMKQRQKKRMAAQRMVACLTALVHNVVVWSRQWLAEADEAAAKKVGKFGVVRLIRDVLCVSGRLTITRKGRIKKILLNQCDPIGRAVVGALQALLDPEHVRVRLGEL